MSGIIWIIVVGFVAGIIARVLSPGPNNPSGFILTTILGILGAFLATWIGQAIGPTAPTRAPASSPPPSARWWCCSSGTGWWRAARFRTGINSDVETRHGRGKSAKRVFALDVPGIHVFATALKVSRGWPGQARP
jgi:uncharacterized membrane protein YeaQ/YmgE (transglycosylase-associated protein family)